MNFIPFKQYDNILFDMSKASVIDLLVDAKQIIISEKNELGKIYPSIQINNENIYFVFSIDGNTIRYIETSNIVLLNGFNLTKESLANIGNHFSKLDKSLIIDAEGSVKSRKFGFTISKIPSQTMNSVLLYSKTYLEEGEITPDDIINYYLNKNKNQT